MLWIFMVLLVIAFFVISILTRCCKNMGIALSEVALINGGKIVGAVIGSIGGIAIGLRGTIGEFVIAKGIAGVIVGGFIGIMAGVVGGALLCLVLLAILRIVILEPLTIAHIAHDIDFRPLEAAYNSSEDYLILQLLKKKAKGNLIAYVSLLVAFVWECVLFIQITDVSILITAFLTILLLLLISANQRILHHRAEQGLYGTCYSEAKEIVTFILKWRGKDGNFDNKPPPVRLVPKSKRKFSSEKVLKHTIVDSKIQRKIPVNV